MDPPPAAGLASRVAGILDTLDKNYKALHIHPYATGTRTDDVSKRLFLDLLNRAPPLTEEEEVIYEFVRQLAQVRNGFMEGAFRMRRGCLSLCVDGMLIGTALGTTKEFSIVSDHTGAYVIGPPVDDPSPCRTERRGGHDRGRREDGYRRDRPRRPRGYKGRRTPADARSRPPLISAETCELLLRELEELPPVRFERPERPAFVLPATEAANPQQPNLSARRHAPAATYLEAANASRASKAKRGHEVNKHGKKGRHATGTRPLVVRASTVPAAVFEAFNAHRLTSAPGQAARPLTDAANVKSTAGAERAELVAVCSTDARLTETTKRTKTTHSGMLLLPMAASSQSWADYASDGSDDGLYELDLLWGTPCIRPKYEAPSSQPAVRAADSGPRKN